MLKISKDRAPIISIDDALAAGGLGEHAAGYTSVESGTWSIVYDDGSISGFRLKCYQFELNTLNLRRVDRDFSRR